MAWFGRRSGRRSSSNQDLGGGGLPQIDGFTDLHLIGKGGAALVYHAYQDAMGGRDVALKVLRGALHDRNALARFDDECNDLGSLSGVRNVVVIHSKGITADGRPWLCMEYFPHGSLAKRLKDGGGPMALAEVAGHVAGLAAALAAAHGRSIFHRDVKPENAFFVQPDDSSRGITKLSDFGISIRSGVPNTNEALQYWSPLHASPETLQGRGGTAADDIYSLASTTYQLLGGSPPFLAGPGESRHELELRMVRDPVPPLARHGIPEGVRAVVIAGMAKDPDDRPSTVKEFGEAFAAAAGHVAPSVITSVLPDAGPSMGPVGTPLYTGTLPPVSTSTPASSHPPIDLNTPRSPSFDAPTDPSSSPPPPPPAVPRPSAPNTASPVAARTKSPDLDGLPWAPPDFGDQPSDQTNTGSRSDAPHDEPAPSWTSPPDRPPDFNAPEDLSMTKAGAKATDPEPAVEGGPTRSALRTGLVIGAIACTVLLIGLIVLSAFVDRDPPVAPTTTTRPSSVPDGADAVTGDPTAIPEDVHLTSLGDDHYLLEFTDATSGKLGHQIFPSGDGSGNPVTLVPGETTADLLGAAFRCVYVAAVGTDGALSTADEACAP